VLKVLSITAKVASCAKPVSIRTSANRSEVGIYTIKASSISSCLSGIERGERTTYRMSDEGLHPSPLCIADSDSKQLP
jgi:hypothetical protein